MKLEDTKKLQSMKVGQKIRMTYVYNWMDHYIPGIKIGTELTIREIKGEFIMVNEDESICIYQKWVEPVKNSGSVLKSGQKVLITKPTVLHRKGHVSWVPLNMDYLDGTIHTLVTLDEGASSYISGWYLDHDWLTPLIEAKGRYFRKATHDDIGNECYFTDCGGFDQQVAETITDGRSKWVLKGVDSLNECYKTESTTWCAAYVEVFDKTTIDKAEKAAKIGEVKQDKTQGDPKVRELKVGQKVRIKKPTDNSPVWVSCAMDKFDGRVFRIDKVNSRSEYVEVQGFAFLNDWITPVEEDLTDSQLGAKIATKVEDSKETFEVKFNGQTLGTTSGPLVYIEPNAPPRGLVSWGFQETNPSEYQTTVKISQETLEELLRTNLDDTITPAENSAKPPKKEKPKMALLALASKTVRNAAWSVVDWSLVTPAKNTLRPVGKVLQYATCYALLGTVVYCGWSLYHNPSWVFEKVTELSPVEIRFKNDPANESVSAENPANEVTE